MPLSAFSKTAVDRRSFLRISGTGALAIAGASILAACSTDSKPSSSSTGSKKADYGTIAIQLSWIKNIEFAGEYFATDKGYYKDAGFTAVNLLAGGGQTTAEEAVTSGQALVGLSSPSITGPAVAQGAPLKIIGTTYQKNPFCLMSLAEKTPIKTVAEMKGKRIGVQSGGNQTIFEGFLKANGLTDKDVELVATQYDIAPLEAGKYDAHMSYVSNEPILAKQDGYTPVLLELADNGLPFVAETFTVLQDTIDSKRDLLKAFLKAEIQGWTDAVKDPAGSANKAVTDYGKDQKLDETEQTSEATAQNTLILTKDVNDNGLFTMTQDLIDANIKALGVMGTTLTADKLFDLSLLDEVYKENPELKVSFTIPAAS
ncbi:ABC transporter substrate-binding protein [Gryllotalpicola koreensis]|uniref:Thiamine pyrimidine synthase n=1 Tax=Gryllotalpicola koreensis TaxID=993086 RepID=A0ABP8A657_9MICO